MTDGFQSTTPFNAERIHAAAVYCSDGRFSEQFDDFVVDGLGLPRYDRLAVPGGAACLAGYFDTWREQEAAVNQLRFLIEAHQIEHVVLIAHEGCAFYTERLKISQLGLEDRQREDLGKAAATVLGLKAQLTLHTYLAHVVDDAVQFEHVTVV
jgi:hypothetical protein